MTASFGKGVMIRDTLFTCPVLRRVVYLVSGYTTVNDLFTVKVFPFWKHL